MVEILPEWGRMIAAIVTLVVMSPFLWALMVKEVSMPLIRKLGEGSVNRVPLTLMIVFRILHSFCFSLYNIFPSSTNVPACCWDWYIHCCSHFYCLRHTEAVHAYRKYIYDNLNEREFAKTGRRNTSFGKRYAFGLYGCKC